MANLPFRLTSTLGIIIAIWLCMDTAGHAFENVDVGSVIENVKMPKLGGGKARLLSRAKANVFVFFRPEHEYSRLGLQQVAVCEKEFANKSVHWVAIVSSTENEDAVRNEIETAGIGMPVLIDQDDALYGKLGVRLHPATGIVDRKGRLVAYQPFIKVNFCDALRARIRHLLGETTDQELERVLHPLASNTESSEMFRARRFVKLAEIQLKREKFEHAVDSARKAIEIDPKLKSAYALLGNALAKLGKCEEAEATFNGPMKLDEKNPLVSEGRDICEKEASE